MRGKPWAMMRYDRRLFMRHGVHEADYVHDMAYDYHGTRLAICTSSLRISIYSAPAHEEGPWEETARMEKAHLAAIWRLAWGQLDFGEILASCSQDCQVYLWKEPDPSDPGARRRPIQGQEPPKLQRHGPPIIVEHPVLGVHFAPLALGNKLAACSAEGFVRVFQNLTGRFEDTWEQTEGGDLMPSEDFKCTTSAASVGATAAVAWKPVHFGEFSEEELQKRPEEFETLAVAGRGRLLIWSKKRDTASGKQQQWRRSADVETPGAVRDLAWCPNFSRPYDLVATCGVGAALWKVTLPDWADDARFGHSFRPHGPSCQVQLLAHLAPSPSEGLGTELIWRCSWNLMGDTLALCHESDKLSIWKAESAPPDEWPSWTKRWELDMGDDGEEVNLNG